MGMMFGVRMMNGIEVCAREWLDGGICRVRGMMVLGTRRRRCEAHSQDPVHNPRLLGMGNRQAALVLRISLPTSDLE